MRPPSRRDLLRGVSSLPLASAAAAQSSNKPFRLWTFSDPHVFSDLYLRSRELRRLNPAGDLLPHEPGLVPRADARESLGSAIEQSESSQGFEWDIGICAGDFSGSHDLPTDREGREIVKQFSRLHRHRREDIYCVAGNHDASPDNRWFRQWIDPTGEHPEHSGVRAAYRPYAVEGTWERYSFRAGNILFLMMSDRNDFAPPVGCIVGDHATGGHPPGAVTKETFEWWKKKVQAEPTGTIIVTVHHHMLKETTIGSGEWEGYPVDGAAPQGMGDRRYHGYMAEDGEHNKGAGYLYWLVDESAPEPTAVPDAQAFETFLSDNPGAIDLWIGGHTHTDPADRKGGRSQITRKWGVQFLNTAALSIHHGGDFSQPLSRLLTFTPGSHEVRAQCRLHTNRFAPQGWYKPAETTFRLRTAFRQ